MSTRSRPVLALLLPLSAAFFFLSTTAFAELAHIFCGGDGDRPCLVSDNGWWEGGLGVDGCDRGLDREWIGTGICWRFWSCNYRYPWRCEVDERVDAFDRKGDSLTAYLQQLELGRNEPINWLNLIGTHNAYNNKSDGYLVPNQSHSITEQLELGSRVLFLDVHRRTIFIPPSTVTTTLKLSHSLGSGLGGSDLDRHFIYALREIREWLRKNPSQFVILRFESYIVDDNQLYDEWFERALSAELGPYLLRGAEKPEGRWPTLAEMRASGRRAIAISDDPVSEYVHNGSYSDGTKAKGVKSAIMAGDLSTLPIPSLDTFTHVEEDHLRKQPPIPGDTCLDYAYPDGLGSVTWWTEGMGMICPKGAPCAKGTETSPLRCPMDRIVSIAQVVDHGFSTVSFDQWMGPVFQEQTVLSYEDDWALSPLTWALRGDYYSGATSRDNRAASMNRESGWNQWHAKPLEDINRYACSYFREGEPTEWFDSIQGNGPRATWKITEREGPWREGWQACAEEFGAEGLIFSVPTNSWQHKDLYRVLEESGADEVWLAYRDTNDEIGALRWDIDRGFAGSGISAAPTPAKEGDVIHLVSEVSSDDLTACRVSFETPDEIAAADVWDMGNGAAPEPSDEFEENRDGLRLIKWHTYDDNFIPYVVTHRLPASCELEDRQHLQVVYNTAPVIRPDCDIWEQCPEILDRGEPMVRAGEPTEIRAAFFDAGAADVHEAQIDWGDGEAGSGTVAYAGNSAQGVSGTVSAIHTYLSCGTFRIDMSVRDDDGGSGTEFQVVQVDEPPPTISCPENIVAEAEAPTATLVDLGQPSVEGGICTPVEVGNDNPGPYPMGLTSVTWTVRNTDDILDPESGEYIRLEDNCEQQVLVVDTTAPVVTAPADRNVTAYQSDPAVDIGTASASDAVGVVFLSRDAPRMFPEGPTTVTWYAIDEAGNIGSDTQLVTGVKRGGGAIGPVLLLLFGLAGLRRYRRVGFGASP